MLQSFCKEIGSINFPDFLEENIYMKPFRYDSLKNLDIREGIKKTLYTVLSRLAPFEGEAYLTVDNKEVKKGSTHRRQGAHIDGHFYNMGWRGEPSWNEVDHPGPYRHPDSVVVNPYPLSPIKVVRVWRQKKADTNNYGGIVLASSFSLCDGWTGETSQKPGSGGSCESFNLNKLDKFKLKSNKIYFGNAAFIHQTMPSPCDVKRQLIRITLPSTYYSGSNFNA